VHPPLTAAIERPIGELIRDRQRLNVTDDVAGIDVYIKVFYS
jgi:hypothetical protein